MTGAVRLIFLLSEQGVWRKGTYFRLGHQVREFGYGWCAQGS